MMQMPLLSYPHFSQFLQLQQQQQQHHQQQQQQQQFQQRYSRVFLSNSQNSETGMLSSSRRSGTSCSEASTGTPSPSPSPPLSINENFSTGNSHQSSAKTSKSFTIDAILGLQDREIEKINRDHLNVMSSSFHPRIGLQLPTSAHLEIPNKYSSLLDLTNATIEIGTRRIDVTRLSTSSRDVLGFQLPTDLSATSDVSTFGSEIGRRDLNHQISSYQTSNSCTRLSEKSPNDSSKKCGGKSKRVRTIFTPEQLERLEAEFERQQYMVGPERLYLAHTLQLTEAQVKVWFQNRRIKWRKQHLEIQQQRLAAIKQQTQRGDIEDSDEESDDSNNYPFIKDSNDNPGNGFYKSAESISEMDNAELGQYRDELGSFQSENCKNESNDGAV